MTTLQQRLDRGDVVILDGAIGPDHIRALSGRLRSWRQLVRQ
jgi:hypothetical protein